MNNIIKSFCGAIVALTIILSASVITHAEPLVTESKDPVYDRVDLTRAEKKAITEMFDAEYYAKTNPDVVEAYGNSKTALLTHFLQYGLWESRQPNDDFNVNAYASAYKDLQKAFGSEAPGRQIVDLYTHYNKYGKEEGRATTTIETCLESDITVRYHGAVDNPVTKGEEARIVAAPAPKPKQGASAPSAPSSGTYSVTFIVPIDIINPNMYFLNSQSEHVFTLTVNNVASGTKIADIMPDFSPDINYAAWDTDVNAMHYLGTGNTSNQTLVTSNLTLYLCITP